MGAIIAITFQKRKNIQCHHPRGRVADVFNGDPPLRSRSRQARRWCGGCGTGRGCHHPRGISVNRQQKVLKDCYQIKVKRCSNPPYFLQNSFHNFVRLTRF